MAAVAESLPAERVYGVPAGFDADVAGAVFTMTNGTDPVLGNEVVAFHRLEDGRLTLAGVFPTGGVGSGPSPTSTVFGPPVSATADGLGSQGSLLLTQPDDAGSRLLFAVNAGSNSLSCFQVETETAGVTLSTPKSVDSRGVFPVSLAFENTGAGRGVLYVLNAGGNGNVAGFEVSGACELAPLGRTRSLTGLLDDPPFPDPPPNDVLTTANDIGFTPDGSQLIVAIKGGPDGHGGGFEGGVVVFDVGSSGRLRDGRPTVTAFSAETGTATPFAFDFDDNGNMVLNHAMSATVASYRVNRSGSLTQRGGPLQISDLGDGSVLTFGAANCWIVIHDGVAYVMNFGDIPATSGGLPDGPGVISAITIDGDGALGFLPTEDSVDGVVAVLPQDDRDDPDARLFGNHGIGLTVVESGDRAFLYALEPRLGEIGIWQIDDDGALSFLENVSGGLTPGVDPFPGTNPGIDDFRERCFLQEEPRSPECAQGSIQGIAGF